MKRVILAAVFVTAISGFAAAQSTSAKPVSKQVKTTVTKPSTTNSKHMVLKQEGSANAKSDSTVKLLLLPLPNVSDSTALPAVKSEEF